MDKKKLTFYIVLFVCTAALTALAVFFGINRQISSAAKSELARDIEKLQSENENLKNREEILQKSLDSKQDETSQKDDLNKKIVEISENIEQIKSDISDKQDEISELQTKSSELSETVTTLNNGMNEKFTASEDYSDTVLLCPAAIDEGRYKISGTGSFSIISLSKSVRLAEDLRALDSNSYIFEIETGETLDINGDATISKLSQSSSAKN